MIYDFGKGSGRRTNVGFVKFFVGADRGEEKKSACFAGFIKPPAEWRTTGGGHGPGVVERSDLDFVSKDTNSMRYRPAAVLLLLFASGGAVGFMLGRAGSTQTEASSSPGKAALKAGESREVQAVKTAPGATVPVTTERAAAMPKKRELRLDEETIRAILPSGPLSSRMLERFHLDARQMQAVKDATASATEEFRKLEKAHSKVETSADGDQYVSIAAYQGETDGLVERIGESLRAAIPDDRASLLASMIERAYGGDEGSGRYRREVYFSQADDPAKLQEGRIIEKAFTADGKLIDTDYFEIAAGQSRWGHLLEFSPSPKPK